jgi:thiol:disulfide interchange protein DsbG
MLKHKVLALAVAVASLGLSVAHAANAVKAGDSAGQYTGEVPAALQRAKVQGGLEIFKDFEAAGGLHGWVVKDKSTSKYVVVYTTPDGQVLLAGMALDVNGQNLTGKYAEQYVPATDYSPAFKAFTSEATSVIWGSKKAKAEVTVVMDPNCPFCQLFERMLKPAVDDGKLRVRLVPVAILGHDSPQRAAGLLVAKDVDAYMAKDIVAGEFTGDVPTSMDQGALAQVKANSDLMRKFGFNGTPAVLYMSGNGGSQTLNVSPGVPGMAELYKKLGLPEYVEKLKATPEFGRFLN